MIVSRIRPLQPWLEGALIAAIIIVYFTSFTFLSVVNGQGEPPEVFGQDSRFIIRALVEGKRYRWNPQNHLLYHVVIERGYDGWRHLVGGGATSAYAYLKLVTTAVGGGFLLAFRALMMELGLSGVRRLVLLILAGFSVSLWFHFAAFETCLLTLPATITFFLALFRRVRRRDTSFGNHVLLVGSLLVDILSRTDHWRLPLVLALLIVWPATRSLWRSLTADLAAFGVCWPLGYLLLVRAYYPGTPLLAALRKLTERRDRGALAEQLMRWDNFSVDNLWSGAKANGLYSILVPPGRADSVFSQDLSAFLVSPLAVVSLAGATALLFVAAWQVLGRLRAKDPIHMGLCASCVLGWLFYVWFNPWEPFLWTPQFAAIQWVAVADVWPRTRRWTVALAVVSLLVVAHNWNYFLLVYRAP